MPSSDGHTLDPTMPAVVGFGVVLTDLARTIDANWQGTIDHLDPECLHDLRVGVRRTRSVLAQSKKVLPPDLVAWARDRFAWLGDLTGPARDLDVYLLEWDGYTRPLGDLVMAALEPVRAGLTARQATAHAVLDDNMRSAAATDLMTTWHAQLAGLTTHQPQGTRATRPLGRVIGRRIRTAQADLVEHGRSIGPDSPADELHELRKDAKKLRYLLECFDPLLPGAPTKRFVRRLKALQDNLGEHQDAQVHIALLDEIGGELHHRGVAGETVFALARLTQQLEHVRAGARAEFGERFAAYDTAATRDALDATIEELRH